MAAKASPLLILFQLLGFLLVTVTVPVDSQQPPGNQPEKPDHGLCQPITIPLCKEIGYNTTIMPNILGHDSQENAGYEVTAFQPLVKIRCSPQLKIFLCSLFLPVCTIVPRPLPPCRSVCIAARNGCSALMEKFGYNWPANMACERFPDPPELCVGPQDVSNGETTDSGSAGGSAGVERNTKPVIVPELDEEYIEPTTSSSPVIPGGRISSECPEPWKKQKYLLTVNEQTVIGNCGLPCNDVMFTRKEETFARYWIGVWAILCFVSTLFTVLTFLIDMRRFKYPERPIIFISGCYLIVSLCYVVGFALEDRVACITADGGESVVTQGTKNEGCTILFMLTYFFTMASSIWWVILTLTWVLAAGLKWGHEAIESNSQYFHLAAWAIPAIKTITIIAQSAIDGDILSGVCFTGLSDKTSLIGYIIAPLIVYLSLGTIFLVAGFISLFNIRTVIKHSGTKTTKLEKLMVRIGIFSVLYTVPAIIVIACNIYELLNRETWLLKFMAINCMNPHLKGSIACPENFTALLASKPVDFTWFIFKYLGYLVVGITSGFWIWSGKTVSSWRKFFHKVCCCCGIGAPREAQV